MVWGPLHLAHLRSGQSWWACRVVAMKSGGNWDTSYGASLAMRRALGFIQKEMWHHARVPNRDVTWSDVLRIVCFLVWLISQKIARESLILRKLLKSMCTGISVIKCQTLKRTTLCTYTQNTKAKWILRLKRFLRTLCLNPSSSCSPTYI